jgi:hypothetical protein
MSSHQNGKSSTARQDRGPNTSTTLRSRTASNASTTAAACSRPPLQHHRAPPFTNPSHTLHTSRRRRASAAPRRAGRSTTPAVCRGFTSNTPHNRHRFARRNLPQAAILILVVSATLNTPASRRLVTRCPRLRSGRRSKSLPERHSIRGCTNSPSVHCGPTRLHGGLQQPAGEGISAPAQRPVIRSKGRGLRQHLWRQSCYGRPLADDDLAAADEDA